MMNYKGWAIPEGNVVKVEDASGRVLWKLETSKPVVLQVEKITSDTYAGETTYTGEQFILLDIYPKTNGTVKVTYGGLTKTITDTSGVAEPNAQQVFFGTFNGVSDSVATPANGELTIEGDCYGFGIGDYSVRGNNKTETKRCSCVTSVSDLKGVSYLPPYAFYNCVGLTSANVPRGVTKISDYIFSGCTGLVSANVSSNKIAAYMFQNCSNLKKVEIANGVTSITYYAFAYCSALTNINIPASIERIDTGAFSNCTGLVSVSLLATTPPEVGGDITGKIGEVFSGCAALTTIVVPAGCGEVYKAAEGWSTYADRIVEAS